ncbi:phosphonate C-P lyase system protein PhnH [Bacillaceae bacterium Marseille-Q3522]|nr:phosphonate C-P lyase system protein PhnH [Bacillaceae bacterium Marseille-Q3522]
MEKTFDTVRDTQQIFRHLVNCMSRPGDIETIAPYTETLGEFRHLSAAMIGVAYTLLDGEVTFHLRTENGEEADRYLQIKTMSKPAAINEANYIFLKKRLSELEFSELMAQIKRGSLEDPHSSATLIIEVDELNQARAADRNVILSGPGMKEQKSRYIAGLPANWLVEREKVNREYPMGVDIIFTTGHGELMALPRTTLVKGEME